MLPRLSAEEKLADVHIGLLGSGFVKKPDLRRALSRLEKAANGGRSKAVKVTPDMLAAAGIAVVTVERKEKADG